MKKKPGRPPRTEQTVVLQIRLSKAVDDYLKRLVAGGLDGSTRQEVIDRLITEGIRDRKSKNLMPDPLPETPALPPTVEAHDSALDPTPGSGA